MRPRAWCAVLLAAAQWGRAAGCLRETVLGPGAETLVVEGLALQSCPVTCNADCVVECRGEDSCAFMTLTCRDGARCEMRCIGEKSCQNSRFLRTGDAALMRRGASEQRCTGERACAFSEMHCGGGSCDRECAAHLSCLGAKLSLEAASQRATWACKGSRACQNGVAALRSERLTPLELHCTGDGACADRFKMYVDDGVVAVDDAALDPAFASKQATCGDEACCAPDMWRRCHPPSTPAPPTPLPPVPMSSPAPSTPTPTPTTAAGSPAPATDTPSVPPGTLTSHPTYTFGPARDRPDDIGPRTWTVVHPAPLPKSRRLPGTFTPAPGGPPAAPPARPAEEGGGRTLAQLAVIVAFCASATAATVVMACTQRRVAATGRAGKSLSV